MPRERWSSRLGFLLAGIGSAVGLGNVWRFPYITGQNGGGAFLIPYVISVLLLGIPLMMLEISVGRHFKRSVVSSMRSINGRLTWVGLFVVLVALLVLSYYLVVTGWTFAYFLYALSGTEPVFEEFTRTYNSLLFFVVVTVLMALIVARGIRGGIERTNQLLVPAFVILLLLLAVYALALPRAVDGVLFYLTPDFTRLSDYSVWLAAFGQAFFSLSVGSGILITYGSYLDESVSLPSNMGIIALTDSFISFISGLVIFPIVFSFGFEPAAGPEARLLHAPLCLRPGALRLGLSRDLLPAPLLRRYYLRHLTLRGRRDRSGRRDHTGQAQGHHAPRGYCASARHARGIELLTGRAAGAPDARPGPDGPPLRHLCHYPLGLIHFRLRYLVL